MNQFRVFFITLYLCTTLINAQVGINNPNPDSSSALDIKSNKKGILIPRLSSVERGEIKKPADGLMVYDNTLQQYSTYSNNQWQVLNPWRGNIGNNEDVYLNNVGKVGIGTTAPQNTLHLVGKSNNDVSLMLQPATWNSTNDYGTIYFGDNSHYIRGQWGEGTTIFDANQTRIMGGNVGIGTTAALIYKLEVNGTLGLFRPSDGTNSGVFEFGTDLNNSWRIVERANNQNSYEIYRNDNGSRKGPFLSINPVTSVIGIRNSLVVEGKLTVGDSLVLNDDLVVNKSIYANEIQSKFLSQNPGILYVDASGLISRYPSGPILGRMRHITYHNFNQPVFRNAEEVNWLPAPGGESPDDGITNYSNSTPAYLNDKQAWLTPYNGRIVRVIVRAGNPSGRLPAAKVKLILAINDFVRSSQLFNINYGSSNIVEISNMGINKGDMISVGFNITDGGADINYIEDTNYYVTLIWEFEVD